MPSHLHPSLLDFRHAALHRILRQLGRAQSVGITPLDLFPHLIQIWRIPSGDGIHGLDRLGHLLLHLGLLQLAKKLGALCNFLLQRHGVAFHCFLRSRSLLQSLIVQFLGVLHRLLRSYQLGGKRLGGVFILGSFLDVPRSPGLIRQLDGLPSIGLQLLNIR